MRDFYKFILIAILFIAYNQISFAESDHTELPLKFNSGNPAPYGLPSTEISIQGKTIPVLLDTGAWGKAEVALSKRALRNVHVNFTNEQECYEAVDGSHCERIFIIPELKVGEFTLKNVKGTLMKKLWGSDNTFRETEASLNGVIGHKLLTHFNVLLDYANNKVIFYRLDAKPAKYDLTKWTSIPFHDNLQSDLKVNGKSLKISWDTAAAPSIIKSSATDYFKLKASPCPSNLPSYLCSRHSQRVNTDIFATHTGKNLPQTWFLVSNLPPEAPFDALMGSNFFEKNLVFFNFQQNKVYVKAQETSAIG